MSYRPTYLLRRFIRLLALFELAGCVVASAWAADSVPVPVPLPGASAPASAPAAATTFTLLELSDPATAVFQVAGEYFQRRLTLNYDAKTASGPLRVELSKLDGPGGVLVEPKLSRLDGGDVSDVAAQGKNWVEFEMPIPPVEFKVSAVLPRIGDYTGYLRYKAGSQPYQTRPIRMTRAAAVVVPVEVGTLQKISGNTSALSLTFSIQGAVDQDLTLMPGVFELALKGTSADKLNPSYESKTFVPQPVKVPKANTAEVELTFKDLSPGEYSGKLTLASAPYIPKQQVFTFSVRRPWGCAFLLVILGAGTSLVLKYMSSRIRPRLVVRAAVAKLLRQGNSLYQAYVLDSVEANVLEPILARVSVYYEQSLQPGNAPTGWADAARQAIEREGAKLSAYSDWINARRTLASITGLDTARRNELDAKLDASRRALRSEAPLDPAARLDLSTTASDITELKADLAQQAAAQTAQQVGDAMATAQDSKALMGLRQSKIEVERAKERLQVRDYAGFKDAYDAAGLTYFQAVSQELRSLTSPAAAIDGGLARAPGLGAVSPAVHESLNRAVMATDLQSARAHYLAARALLDEAQVGGPDLAPGTASSQPGGGIPDAGVLPSPVLIPKLVVEDTEVLTQQIRRLDFTVDAAAVLSAGVLGVLLVWAPNPGWGQWSDMFAALLWGLGLYSVGTQTFEGILGMRAKLSPG